MKKNIWSCGVLFLLAVGVCFFSSCSKNETVQSINETELFKIPYGKFEEQLSVSELNEIGDVRFGMTMQDGFFYIINGEAKKIMELNSYGDLLTLFYNEDSYTSSLLESSKRKALSTRHEVNYPFDYTGFVVTDSNKNIYAACSVPLDRQEQSEDGTMLYSQTVLRFARNGSSVEYIGQQGPGGTPFPYIRNIYTTSKDELVVVGQSTQGLIVYWFATDGFLKYMIPVYTKDVPSVKGIADNSEVYCTIENVIPDPVSYRLYVHINYYSSYFDEDSNVESGVNYIYSLLYSLNIETGLFEDSVTIPSYEESVISDYTRLTYKKPYDFLGVTKNGWKFFIIKTDDGFNVAMLQSESQRLLTRHFSANFNNLWYYSMNLSQTGIMTALYIEKDNARVVLYRTDDLIDAIIKN